MRGPVPPPPTKKRKQNENRRDLCLTNPTEFACYYNTNWAMADVCRDAKRLLVASTRIRESDRGSFFTKWQYAIGDPHWCLATQVTSKPKPTYTPTHTTTISRPPRKGKKKTLSATTIFARVGSHLTLLETQCWVGSGEVFFHGPGNPHPTLVSQYCLCKTTQTIESMLPTTLENSVRFYSMLSIL